jgi:hypothetical protein
MNRTVPGLLKWLLCALVLVLTSTPAWAIVGQKTVSEVFRKHRLLLLPKKLQIPLWHKGKAPVVATILHQGCIRGDCLRIIAFVRE